MPRQRKQSSRLLLGLLALASVVALRLAAFHPDGGFRAIEPGSSPVPSFVVQLVRPRLALPLAGLVPPQWVGADARLRFDSETPGASARATPERVEFRAPGWEVVVGKTPQGALAFGTGATFDLRLEGRRRSVRCRPARPPTGTLDIVRLPDGSGLSGSFEVELGPCEDARTGRALGWPSAPLVLRGSFDRLGSGRSQAAE